MSKARKFVVGALAVFVLLTAAALGIWGWQQQFLGASVAKSGSAQATAVGLDQVPISVRPLLR
jgi:hypothetical protein